MMGDVFIQICDAEEQFEDAAFLREVVLGSDFRERVEGDVGIGEQPVQGGAVNRFAAVAAVESEVGARERLIEKVIEAERFGNECRRHLLFTFFNAAASGGSRRHETSFSWALGSRQAEANLSYFRVRGDVVPR